MYPSYQGYSRSKPTYQRPGFRPPSPMPRAPIPRAGGSTSPRKPILPAGGNPSYPDLPGDTQQRPAATDIGYNQPSFEDPALAQIRALSARSRSEATSRALSKKKQAAIQYGDPSGVQGLDQGTIDAARNNPFSILKNTERSYTEGVGRLEDAFNKSNLFYSGYRGTELGKAATGYQQQRYDAGTRFQATITDIEDALAQALLQADMMEMQSMLGSGNYSSGGGGGDNGAGYTGRPGEANPAGLGVLEGWDPSRNSDAKYDTSGLVWDGSAFVDAFGYRYDRDGRRV